LDTTSTDESSYIELKPFIFIPEWQTTIQAKWDNAPPACTYCKQSGHLIRDCQIKLNSAMGIRTCYLCQQAGHTSRECPRKNGDSETDPSHTNENNKKGNNPTQNKKQKQVHIDTENIQKITTQKDSATTIITPTKNEQDHNNNNHQSQESIDVESLTNSQLREINVVQTVVSQQMSTDNSKPIETLNEEDNTVDEEDADYCTEDDQMSTESDDSHAADTNDQR